MKRLVIVVALVLTGFISANPTEAMTYEWQEILDLQAPGRQVLNSNDNVTEAASQSNTIADLHFPASENVGAIYETLIASGQVEASIDTGNSPINLYSGIYPTSRT
ncbi:MAG: hypothetical protein MI867_02230, partial [Pseudomonadales bacterium]|nr:hypothetical protein [Pseudomonadales bacterium]